MKKQSLLILLVSLLPILLLTALGQATAVEPQVTLDTGLSVSLDDLSLDDLQKDTLFIRGAVSPATEGLTVVLMEGDRPVDGTLSAVDGSFAFSGVPDGIYELAVWDENSESIELGESYFVDRDSALNEVVLELPGAASGDQVRAAELNNGVIKVTVKAADTGLPVPAYVEPDRYTSHMFYQPQFIYDGVTPASFEQLDTEHEYRIFVGPSDSRYLNQNYDGIDANGPNSPNTSFTPVIFPNGEELIELEVTVQRSAGITGTVIAADTNLPLNNVQVKAKRPNDPYGSLTDYTDTNGAFEFSQGIPGGTITVTAQGDFEGIYVPSSTVINTNYGITTTNVTIALQKSGVITGMVTADGTGLPIPNAQVSLQREDAGGFTYLDSRSTNENGVYVFDRKVSTGNYRIQVFDTCISDFECFIGEFYEDAKLYTEATLVPATTEQTVSNIDFALVKKAVLRGTIKSADTAEVLDAQIQVYDENFNYVTAVSVSEFNPEFNVLVDAGTYYLEADPSSDVPYVGEYYNAKTRDTADAIMVTAGQELSNLDFTLDRGGTISATIIDSVTQQPIEDVEVEVYDASPKRVYDAALDTGDYYVRFRKDGYVSDFYPGGKTLGEATPISVTRGQATPINVELDPLAKISGKITNLENDLPSADFTLIIEPLGQEVDVLDDGSFSAEFDASLLPDGKATIAFGEIRYCYNLDPFEEIVCPITKYSAYGQSSSSNTPTPISVAAGEHVTDVNFAVELDAKPIIQGFVKDAKTGENIDAILTLYRSPLLDQFSWPPQKAASIDCSIPSIDCTNGYKLVVDPGTYYLEVVADSYLTNSYEGSKTPINIKAGDVLNMADIELMRGGTISGTVTDKDTNQPVPSLGVSVVDIASGENVASELTEFDGTFKLDKLPDGTYTLYFIAYFQAPGPVDYAPEYLGGTQNIEEATPIVIKDGNVVTINPILASTERSILQINFILESSGNPITGTGVPVDLYRADGTYAGGTISEKPEGLEPNVATMRLNESGTFHIFKHTFGFEEYYLSADSIEEATPIHLTHGTTTTVDFPFREPGSVQLNIKSAETGEPIELSIPIEIYQLDPECGGRTFVRISPRRNVWGLDPNQTYQIIINDRPGAGGKWNFVNPNSLVSAELNNISVQGGETAEYEILLEKGGQISGVVTASDTDAPLNLAEVQLYQRKGDGSLDLFYTGYTNYNGEYTLIGLPEAEYFLRFNTNIGDEKNASYYISQFYGGTPQAVTVTKDSEIVINQALQKGGVIQGWVMDQETGDGLRDQQVSAYRVTADGLELERHVVSKGSFYISGLPDGDYLIKSEPKVNREATNVAEFRPTWYGDVQHEEDATSITISNGTIHKGIAIKQQKGSFIHGTLFVDDLERVNFVDYIKDDFLAISVYDESGTLVTTVHVDMDYSWERSEKYAISGLWAGKYYVYFHSTTREQIGTCTSHTHFGQWYGGSADFENATPIIVTNDGQVGDIDGHLATTNPPPSLPSNVEAPSKQAVTGKITAAGNPLPGVTVASDSGPSTVTNGDGEYTLYLKDGSHTLTPSKNGYTFSPADRGITVSGADLAGQDFAATPLPSGSIGGTVTGVDSGTKLSGVDVLAYAKNGSAWQFAGMATTGDDGSYKISDLAPAEYRVLYRTALQTHKSEYYDDAQSFSQGANVMVASGADVTGIDASLEQRPEAAVLIEGVESYTDPDTGKVTLTASRTESENVTISRKVSCDSGDPSDVKLIIGSKAFSMTGAAGTYSATLNIPADISSSNEQSMSVQYVCSGVTESVSVGELVLFDPSGIITDAKTGDPITGASVTLHRVAGAVPDTASSTNDCRTVDTRPVPVSGSPFGAWSGVEAATATTGHPVDASFDTLNGQALFSPAVPTLTTGADGRYGWDVAEGCWYVVVEANGYETMISPVVGVPPAVLDLNIALSPDSFDVYLPVIVR